MSTSFKLFTGSSKVKKYIKVVIKILSVILEEKSFALMMRGERIQTLCTMGTEICQIRGSALNCSQLLSP